MRDDVTHISPETVKYYNEHADTMHDHNIDMHANHIYLVGEESYVAGTIHDDGEEPGVEYCMANAFIRNMNLLMRMSDKPILIHMKTCGGDWVEGMVIHDLIKACPNKVTILNYSHARSMSSLIFQAADKRVMMPNSYFLFHDGTMGYQGTSKQFLTEAKELEYNGNVMLDIYVAAMRTAQHWGNHSDKQIRNWLRKKMDKKEDVYVRAYEAVELGFADEVFGNGGVYDWEALTEYE